MRDFPKEKSTVTSLRARLPVVLLMIGAGIAGIATIMVPRWNAACACAALFLLLSAFVYEIRRYNRQLRDELRSRTKSTQAHGG